MAATFLLLHDHFDDPFTFYLGTDRVNWLWREGVDVPLFVSHSRLRSRKSLPRAVVRWACDSAGFTDVSREGRFRQSPRDYARAVRRYADEIGMMDFASIQDWMCEPFILARTRATVADHQSRTIRSYLELNDIAPDVNWIPVLQGYAEDDYMRHVEQYEGAGIRRGEFPRVGLGSVCRRENTREAERLIVRLHREGLRIHAFGFKARGLARISSYLASADSMAWSFTARRGERLPDCSHRARKCSGCLRYALRWRERTLRAAARPQNGFLFV